MQGDLRQGGTPLAAGDIAGPEGPGAARSASWSQRRAPAAIYGGSLGRAIDATMQEAGGFLALEDLVADRAEWWTPISITYRDYEVMTPSAPAGAFPDAGAARDDEP